MANLQVGGMKTLAQSLDVPNATNQALLDAWVQVEHMKMTIPHKEGLLGEFQYRKYIQHTRGLDGRDVSQNVRCFFEAVEANRAA